MKKYITITLTTIISVSFCVHGQSYTPEIEWSQTYGSIYLNQISDIKILPNGKAIAVGEKEQEVLSSNFESESSLWVLFVDNEGNYIHNKSYGSGGNNVAKEVEALSDGGAIIIGEKQDSIEDDLDIWILRVDSTGDTIWTKEYGGDTTEYSYSILALDDGGFIAAATTFSYSVSGSDIWILRLDSSGDTLWTKIYGDDNHDVASKIIEANDEGFITCGWDWQGVKYSDVSISKYNLDGDTLWTKHYGGNETDLSQDIKRVGDDGYIIAGSVNVRNYEIRDEDDFYYMHYQFWAMRIDNNGDTLWTKQYGGDRSERAHAIEALPDGTFLISGSSESFSGGEGWDIWIIKLDENGDSLWSILFDGGDWDGCYTTAFFDEHNFYAAGYKMISYDYSQGLLIKISEGVLSVRNPFDNEMDFNVMNKNRDTFYEIFDAKGRRVGLNSALPAYRDRFSKGVYLTRGSMGVRKNVLVR